MIKPALGRDIDRLGRLTRATLTLRAVGGTGQLQRLTPAPRVGEATIEQITSGEPRLLVQCSTRPRQRFWIAGVFEER